MSPLFAWASVALAVVLMSPQVYGAAAADLVVGQVAPLSGVLASTGRRMVVGGKNCFDAVNAQGGVHCAQICHDVLDDGYKVAETTRLMRELLAKPEVLDAGGAALVAPHTEGESLRSLFNPWIFHV